MIISNIRDFKKKQELIQFSFDSKTSIKWTITEAKQILEDFQTRIMWAESNELISTLLRSFSMDEAQVETAIQQLNKLREKL